MSPTISWSTEHIYNCTKSQWCTGTSQIVLPMVYMVRPNVILLIMSREFLKIRGGPKFHLQGPSHDYQI
jgi:hypothetical protein